MLSETFPDLPAFCRIPQEQRRESWIGRELRPAAGMIVIGRTVVRDPGTERVRQEVEAAQAARRAVDLVKKRDDEAIRKRGIKNRRIIALAIAGEVVLPPPPVKIVRVIDLNQPGHQPATQESDVKKTAAKKPARKVKATKAAKRSVKKKSAARSAARTPVGKVDVVQMIADMMARPIGHPDAPLGGASMAEMVKAAKVEAHPMRRKIKLARDVLGYTTVAPSKANGNRYFATPPKKKV